MEELSLHQEDIEKIEHIQNWCRDLKILLMQNNLIDKLQNLFKLKKLEYLNLALNNIERIENLDGLESLNKLDLTLNFIGELTSVSNLKANYHLNELILTGNPCCDYPGYRAFVIAVLPQLKTLDGVDIKRSEKIVAEKLFNGIRAEIVQLQAEYVFKRDAQKKRINKRRNQTVEHNAALTEDEINERCTNSLILFHFIAFYPFYSHICIRVCCRFWKESSEHCPETRHDIAMQQRRNRQTTVVSSEQSAHERKFFADCGRPYHLNETRLQFRFNDEDTYYALELTIYK